MEKFIFLYRGGMDRTLPPEAMQAQMQKWITWMDSLQKKGILGGSEPLQPTGKLVSGKDKVVTDGPFIEAKEIVGGYTIVTAENIDEAVEISKGCPIFESNGMLEIRPLTKM